MPRMDAALKERVIATGVAEQAYAVAFDEDGAKHTAVTYWEEAMGSLSPRELELLEVGCLAGALVAVAREANPYTGTPDALEIADELIDEAWMRRYLGGRPGKANGMEHWGSEDDPRSRPLQPVALQAVPL